MDGGDYIEFYFLDMVVFPKVLLKLRVWVFITVVVLLICYLSISYKQVSSVCGGHRLFHNYFLVQ